MKPDAAALNTLARVFHSGEEIEGDDGAAMMVDMALWNEGCEALESLIGEGDDETLASSAARAVPAPFDRTTALVLLQAASKSGDPGAISLAAQLAGAAPCTDCGYVNFKCRCAAPAVPAVPAVPDGLRDAVNALLHQIEIGDFVDSNGHSAKMLKPVHDLMRLISESAAPAVPAAQIGMKASTWETLSPDAQNLILEAGQRAVDKTKARRITDAAARAAMEPIPLDGSAADNAALLADNIRLQNEVVGPLRERVKEAEAESLAFVYERNAAQERVHALAGRVKVLEDALGGLLFAEQDECTLENYAAASEAARAALGDKP